MKPQTLLKISILLSFIIFSISPGIAYGQQKYNGYYVSKTGDTTFGSFMNYTQWVKNPRDVSFKPDGGDALLTLKPGDVSLFSINNLDTYVSKEISRMTNVIHIGNIGLSIPPEYKEVEDVYENLHVFCVRFIIARF